MTLVATLDDQNAKSALAEAARILLAGGTVAFPTETVYGLGADATSAEAVARIYAAKGRPAFNPLIAHVASFEAARAQGHFSKDAEKLATAFWPGPLTLVLPLAASATVCALARAGLASVALRVPNHPIAHALIETFGRPLAAPSANRSGRMSPVTAAHVLSDLNGAIDMILHGGPTKVGLEFDDRRLSRRRTAPVAAGWNCAGRYRSRLGPAFERRRRVICTHGPRHDGVALCAARATPAERHYAGSN